MFRSPPQMMWDLTIHPLWGPAFLLAHRLVSTPIWGPASLLAHRLVSTPFWGSASSLARRLVSGSDTIRSPSSSTASRYYPFWAFPLGFSFKVFKMRLLGRGFHTLIKNVSFSSPTDVGSHSVCAVNELVLVQLIS